MRQCFTLKRPQKLERSKGQLWQPAEGKLRGGKTGEVKWGRITAPNSSISEFHVHCLTCCSSQQLWDGGRSAAIDVSILETKKLKLADFLWLLKKNLFWNNFNLQKIWEILYREFCVLFSQPCHPNLSLALPIWEAKPSHVFSTWMRVSVAFHQGRTYC